jgi:2-C-methyl-D-erythritol 4-phosphate cytidylyltransferase / 2-C-methyl-D-erythritol 2,4-cyclodiphosphate synthase
VTPFADAVVVAAGASARMAGVDKLAAPLAGRPLLAWSCEALLAADSVRRLVIVAAPGKVDELRRASWVGRLGADVVEGGPRRQDSVAAGVRAADADVVLVHDGARPFVSPSVVDAVAEAAFDRGAAVPVLPVVDSLKRLDGDLVAAAVERTGLQRAQTPQGAHRTLLLDAYDRHGAGTALFGDEAELLARHGVPVATVAGDPANLKITVPADLELAAGIAAARVGPPRLGAGTDSHPFGPDDGLWLGGIHIPEAPRLFGHSDGDAALHALCDALLGGAGLRDIGRLFPSGEARTRGIASSALVREVVGELEAAGWRVLSVDLTILGARPRLGGARLDAMRDAVAALVELPTSAVGVKAATGNFAGPEGAGRVISASALVSLVRR